MVFVFNGFIKSLWAEVLSVFVNVDLHRLVTTIWNGVDYTNLKNQSSSVLIALLSNCQLGRY